MTTAELVLAATIDCCLRLLLGDDALDGSIPSLRRRAAHRALKLSKLLVRGESVIAGKYILAISYLIGHSRITLDGLLLIRRDLIQTGLTGIVFE